MSVADQTTHTRRSSVSESISTKVANKLSAVREKAEWEYSKFDAMGDQLVEERVDGDTVVHRAAQRQTIVAIIAIAVISMVGNKILSEVDSSIDVANDSKYANASSDISGGFVDSMGLVGLVMLILIASIVIGVITQF